MNIDLSIIILNYNAKKFVLDCIQSIERAKKNDYLWEVIVVDNASTDGSVEAIRNFQFTRLNSAKRAIFNFQIIRNKKNLGFSKGNNVAIPQAKGRYLLFLNPDTVVQSNTLSYMISFMDENPDVGAATCQLKLANGDLDEASHRGFPTPWNAFCHFFGLEQLFPKSRLFSGYALGYLSRDTTHEIDALTGAFMLVRLEAGEKVGWWDEDYFWYGEDIDFCYRLKENNWKIMYVPKVSILHYRGVSSGVKKHSQKVSTATKETRKRVARASIEAMRIFYQKHYVEKYPAPVLWLVSWGIWILEKYRLIFW